VTVTATRPAPAPHVSGGRRDSALPVMVGATVALIPILVPAGPGNTALADAGMAGCLAIAALWVTRERLPVSFPYAAGVALLLTGGALGATVSAAPVGTALVLAQDVFLLLWAATLALGRYDPAILSAATTTWCRSVVVYCAVVILAYLIGFSPLSGVTGADGVRASYTFADPNLAGNYLVTSLFVMVACKRPRAASTRRIGYVLVLVAIGFTGSNGAMLTLLIGAGVCLTVSRYRNRGAYAAVLTLVLAATLSAMLMVFVLPRVDFDAIREQASSGIPLLRDSFGRSGASSSERATILDEGAHLFFEGNATGYGPARTKATLQETQAPYVKEAHNDYLATLLERGIIGALGLLVLGSTVLVRCGRLVTGRLPDAYAAIVPRAWLLVVVAPVMAVAAGFYEVLHFRHLWTWLGIVAALALVLQDEDRSRSRRSEEAGS
jgi:O-Antigen ligase